MWSLLARAAPIAALCVGAWSAVPAQQASTREIATSLAIRASEEADRGDLSAAIRTLEEAARVAPDWAELKVNLAAVRSQAGDYAGAVRAAREALALNPALDGARVNLGLAQLKSGDAAAAAETLAPYATRPDAPPVTLAALGLSLTVLARPADAFEPLARAADAGIDDVDVLYALGRAAFHVDDHARAGRALAALERVAPGSPQASILRGDTLDAHHDWAGAERAYREAIARERDFPRAQYSLGLVLYKQRQYDEAVAAFDRELALNARFDPALYYRGTLELDRGRPDVALPFLQRLTAVAPGRPEGWRALGRAQLALAQHDSAIVTLRESVRLDPTTASTRFLLARALKGAGRDAEAAAELRTAVELNRKVREALEERVSKIPPV
jgi:tetratricopeptide (TPR) repeat protein